MIAGLITSLADHLWQSTLFAGGAGLLTLALRHNGARTRFWLWFAASLKFLLPFTLLAALGTQAAHLLPVPHFRRLRFVIGEAIPVIDPAEGDDDDHLVRRLRREVEGAIHEVFEEELTRRAGFGS